MVTLMSIEVLLDRARLFARRGGQRLLFAAGGAAFVVAVVIAPFGCATADFHDVPKDALPPCPQEPLIACHEISDAGVCTGPNNPDDPFERRLPITSSATGCVATLYGSRASDNNCPVEATCTCATSDAGARWACK